MGSGRQQELTQNFKGLGNEYFRGKPYKEALEFYTIGVEAKPDDGRSGNYVSVLRDCATVIAGNTRAPSKSYYRTGLALLAPEQPDEALDARAWEAATADQRHTCFLHLGTGLAVPAAPSRAAALASTAAIHTTLGDQAPKADENFIGHARSAGYYDGLLFHHVIAKFMIQMGNPLGDGTARTSIWDREARMELITTCIVFAGRTRTNATSWLDKKHTTFGCVLSHAIEDVKTNKADKPYEDGKIINIDIE
ncbi:cyclophilin-like domain-containing protein [Lactifluus subvellereus]|nr:cyclophilin-like domain-containing protein [Lactifluus subvellereus]